jgi:hypothetical protein
VVLQDGKRTDVVELMQAQMRTVDMVPENPGTWMFHCHIDDPMEAGMSALYKVEPRRPAALMIGHLPYDIFVQNSIPWRFVL